MMEFYHSIITIFPKLNCNFFDDHIFIRLPDRRLTEEEYIELSQLCKLHDLDFNQEPYYINIWRIKQLKQITNKYI